MQDVGPMLAALQLEPQRVIQIGARRAIAACRRKRARTATRLAVVADGQVVAVWPDRGSSELVIQRADALLDGRLLLVATRQRSSDRVIGFDVETRGEDTRLAVPAVEGDLIGLDVDASGRWAAMAHRWDDFHSVFVHDARARAWTELGSDSLIDARISDLRWDEGATSAFRCWNDLTEREIVLPIDWDRRLVRWPSGALARDDDVLVAVRQAGGASDWSTVHELLASRPDLLTRAALDEGGPAFHAAQQGALDELEWVRERVPAEQLAEVATVALLGAALGGPVASAAWALDHGASMLLVPDDGETALHAVASVDNAAVAALLLSRGADPTARTTGGESALDQAIAQGSTAVQELLEGLTR